MGSFARVAGTLPLALLALVLAAGSAGADAPLPVLAPAHGLDIERDMPAVVQARIAREQERVRKLAVEASKQPATAAAGCVRSRSGSLGPPAPKVTGVRVIGHHVDVAVDLGPLPESLGCRPWELVVTVSTVGGRGYRNTVRRYGVEQPRGRAVVALPMYGSPPYRLVVGATSILGRRGAEVERRLTCPSRCLRGYSPPLHALPMPRPVLPLIGIDRPTLEASFWQVIEQEQRPPIVAAVPRSVRCPTTKRCVVTRVDPAFPDSPYEVTYDVAGQQVRGCWLGLTVQVSKRRPYDDASAGQWMLAGCASWLR